MNVPKTIATVADEARSRLVALRDSNDATGEISFSLLLSMTLGVPKVRFERSGEVLIEQLGNGRRLTDEEIVRLADQMQRIVADPGCHGPLQDLAG